MNALGNPFPVAAAGHIASKLLDRHSAHEIAEAIEVLVDLLDCLGGDPEAEDATDLEDDHNLSPMALRYARRGPGCDISDTGDISATEWHTRGRFKLSPGIIAKNGMPISEDVEEDDPAGQCDEDGVNTCLIAALGSGPGCKISDPDSEHDGREPSQ